MKLISSIYIDSYHNVLVNLSKDKIVETVAMSLNQCCVSLCKHSFSDSHYWLCNALRCILLQFLFNALHC